MNRMEIVDDLDQTNATWGNNDRVPFQGGFMTPELELPPALSDPIQIIGAGGPNALANFVRRMSVDGHLSPSDLAQLQAQIDVLKAQLAQIQNAQAVNGDDLTAEQKARLQAEIDRLKQELQTVLGAAGAAVVLGCSRVVGDGSLTPDQRAHLQAEIDALKAQLQTVLGASEDDVNVGTPVTFFVDGVQAHGTIDQFFLRDGVEYAVIVDPKSGHHTTIPVMALTVIMGTQVIGDFFSSLDPNLLAAFNILLPGIGGIIEAIDAAVEGNNQAAQDASDAGADADASAVTPWMPGMPVQGGLDPAPTCDPSDPACIPNTPFAQQVSSNGYIWEADSTGGTAGNTAPVGTTQGAIVSDGAIQWTNMGPDPSTQVASGTPWMPNTAYGPGSTVTVPGMPSALSPVAVSELLSTMSGGMSGSTPPMSQGMQGATIMDGMMQWTDMGPNPDDPNANSQNAIDPATGIPYSQEQGGAGAIDPATGIPYSQEGGAGGYGGGYTDPNAGGGYGPPAPVPVQTPGVVQTAPAAPGTDPTLTNLLTAAMMVPGQQPGAAPFTDPSMSSYGDASADPNANNYGASTDPFGGSATDETTTVFGLLAVNIVGAAAKVAAKKKGRKQDPATAGKAAVAQANKTLALAKKGQKAAQAGHAAASKLSTKIHGVFGAPTHPPLNQSHVQMVHNHAATAQTSAARAAHAANKALASGKKAIAYGAKITAAKKKNAAAASKNKTLLQRSQALSKKRPTPHQAVVHGLIEQIVGAGAGIVVGDISQLLSLVSSLNPLNMLLPTAGAVAQTAASMALPRNVPRTIMPAPPSMMQSPSPGWVTVPVSMLSQMQQPTMMPAQAQIPVSQLVSGDAGTVLRNIAEFTNAITHPMMAPLIPGAIVVQPQPMMMQPMVPDMFSAPMPQQLPAYNYALSEQMAAQPVPVPYRADSPDNYYDFRAGQMNDVMFGARYHDAAHVSDDVVGHSASWVCGDNVFASVRTKPGLIVTGCCPSAPFVAKALASDHSLVGSPAAQAVGESMAAQELLHAIDNYHADIHRQWAQTGQDHGVLGADSDPSLAALCACIQKAHGGDHAAAADLNYIAQGGAGAEMSSKLNDATHLMGTLLASR